MAKGAKDSAVLSDALSLVCSPAPPARVVAHWTKAQRKQAWDWVGAEVLAANDHRDIKRRTIPEVLARWMIGQNPHRKARP